MSELWESFGRENEPPYFGWLSTALPCYPDTLNLKTHVHTRPVGLRPLVELEPTEHPLAVEQQNGITMVRVKEIVECSSAKIVAGPQFAIPMIGIENSCDARFSNPLTQSGCTCGGLFMCGA